MADDQQSPDDRAGKELLFLKSPPKKITGMSEAELRTWVETWVDDILLPPDPTPTRGRNSDE